MKKSLCGRTLKSNLRKREVTTLHPAFRNQESWRSLNPHLHIYLHCNLFQWISYINCLLNFLFTAHKKVQSATQFSRPACILKTLYRAGDPVNWVLGCRLHKNSLKKRAYLICSDRKLVNWPGFLRTRHCTGWAGLPEEASLPASPAGQAKMLVANTE